MLKTSIKTTLKCLTLLIVLIIQIQRNCAKTIDNVNSHKCSNSDNKLHNRISNGSSSSIIITNHYHNNNNHEQQQIPFLQLSTTAITNTRHMNGDFKKAQPSSKPKHNRNSTTITANQQINSTVVNFAANKTGKQITIFLTLNVNECELNRTYL